MTKFYGPVGYTSVGDLWLRLMRLCEREHANLGSLPEGGLFPR